MQSTPPAFMAPSAAASSGNACVSILTPLAAGDLGQGRRRQALVLAVGLPLDRRVARHHADADRFGRRRFRGRRRGPDGLRHEQEQRDGRRARGQGGTDRVASAGRRPHRGYGVQSLSQAPNATIE
jgi:hypothetical protein